MKKRETQEALEPPRVTITNTADKSQYAFDPVVPPKSFIGNLNVFRWAIILAILTIVLSFAIVWNHSSPKNLALNVIVLIAAFTMLLSEIRRAMRPRSPLLVTITKQGLTVKFGRSPWGETLSVKASEILCAKIISAAGGARTIAVFTQRARPWLLPTCEEAVDPMAESLRGLLRLNVASSRSTEHPTVDVAGTLLGQGDYPKPHPDRRVEILCEEGVLRIRINRLFRMSFIQIVFLAWLFPVAALGAVVLVAHRQKPSFNPMAANPAPFWTLVFFGLLLLLVVSGSFRSVALIATPDYLWVKKRFGIFYSAQKWSRDRISTFSVHIVASQVRTNREHRKILLITEDGRAHSIVSTTRIALSQLGFIATELRQYYGPANSAQPMPSGQTPMNHG